MGSQQDGRTLVNISIDDLVSLALVAIKGVDGVASGTGLARIGGTDGTLDQILSMDSSGHPVTNRNWTIAGEDIVNSWTTTRIGAHVVLTGTAAVAVNGAAVEVMPSVDVSYYEEVSINIYNIGNPLTNCIVSGSNDNTRWVSLIPIYGVLETACITLASGLAGCAWLSTGFPFKYVKLQCSSGAATSVTYYFYART
jgi:hypothetical protein